MSLGPEYQVVVDNTGDIQNSTRKAGSLCADMQKTVERLRAIYIASNPEINFANTANEVDYFGPIISELVGRPLVDYIQSITVTPTALYEISSDLDGVFIGAWPATVTSGDVTITNLTSRPGESLAEAGTLSGDDISALIINGVNDTFNNILISNCSLYWAVDSIVKVTDTPGLILENCIIAQALNDSFSSNGLYGAGMTIKGTQTPDAHTPLLIRNNLFAHNYVGSPTLLSSELDGDDFARGQLRATFANNVIYNFGSQAVQLDYASASLDGATLELDFVGNIFIVGPDSDLTNAKTIIQQAHADGVYQKDNYIILTDGTVLDLFVWAEADTLSWKQEPNFNVDYNKNYYKVISDVLFNSGSRVRDSYDNIIINDVRKKTGNIVDNVEEATNGG